MKLCQTTNEGSILCDVSIHRLAVAILISNEGTSRPLRICWWTLSIWNRLSGRHFCRRLYKPISIVLSAMSCDISAKTVKDTPYVGSRSFKVIEFGTNRNGICDLLLVVNGILGRISHGFRATVTYWWKKLPLRHTTSYWTSPLRVTPYEYVDERYFISPKTRRIASATQ